MSDAFAHGRQPGLDLARGLAVLGMVYCHYVATESSGPAAWRASAWLAGLLYGKPSALFCLLAGMTWSLMARRGGPSFGRSFARRAAALAALGVGLHLALWPTEILSPLALFMVLALPCLRSPRWTLWALLLGSLAAVPALQLAWGHHVATDYATSGLYLDPWGVPGPLVRRLVFDGSYPVAPFLAYVCVGALLARGDPTAPGRPLRVALSGGLLLLAMRAAGPWLDDSGPWAAHLARTWVPVTIPFFLEGLGAALLVLGVSLAVGARGGAAPVRAVGRLSLTHYVLHLALVFPLLERRSPDWGWPVPLGVALFVAYAVVAALATPFWLRRFGQGPLEKLLRGLAGR